MYISMFRRKRYVILFALFLTFFIRSRASASALHTYDQTNISMYGFIDYEAGFNTKSIPSFYKSNTTSNELSFKGKTSFNSRAQARLGFRFTTINSKTSGNIMIDSWPNNFQLQLAYIHHKIDKNFSITIGKEWSLVNQRFFHFSSFTFKPYAAGFQGSKRTPQITFKYTGYLGNNLTILSFGLEDRNSKDGIVIGKNITTSKKEISSSNIQSFRKVLPALVGQIQLRLKTGLGMPSTIMAYYEAMPTYLECEDGEHKKISYLYSLATKLNIKNISLIGQYIHTLGMSGIAGISGNSLKTFSYIYENKKIIARKSDVLGAEISLKPTDRICLAIGYVSLKFSNKDTNNEYFLKNEVKNVKTIYVAGVLNVTKLTKLFIEWDDIKTKYTQDNNMDGKFEQSEGNQLLFGYRIYF